MNCLRCSVCELIGLVLSYVIHSQPTHLTMAEEDTRDLDKEGFEIQVYDENENVRALDQGKLYPAKVVRCGDAEQYFIHYHGWNKKWDKWVHASLIMKDGPEADKYAKKLAARERKRSGAAARKTDGNKFDNDADSKRKKTRIDAARSLDHGDDDLPQVKLTLPFTLKKQVRQTAVEGHCNRQ